MAWLTRTIAEIAGRGEPLAPEDRIECDHRQTQVAVRILAVANVAHLASLVLTAGFLLPPGRFRTVWGIAIFLLIGNSCRIWSPWVLDRTKPADRHTRRLLMVDVLADACLYFVMAVHAIPQIEEAKLVILAATLVGVIGSGAIALSVVRSVSFVWIGVMLGGLAAGLIRAGAPELPIQLTQVAFYAIALAAAIEYLSWTFEQRFRRNVRRSVSERP